MSREDRIRAGIMRCKRSLEKLLDEITRYLDETGKEEKSTVKRKTRSVRK